MHPLTRLAVFLHVHLRECASAAVRGPRGDIVAAISLSGPVERLSRDPGAAFGTSVLDAARSIEGLLRVGPVADS